jgi:alkylation response protein AidB-like acyl-CoA dehydrogenase
LNLTPEEQAFAAEVRAFLAARLTPRLRLGAAASTGVFAEPDVGREWAAILNARGWLAYDWPVDHGGPGWTPIQRYLFEKELALAGAPALSVIGLKLLAPVLWRFGTPAQQARLLPRILSGEDYWCQGFSEPGSGSDLASLQCRAARDGDRWVVNGTKLWTTHGHHANRVFCLVRTNPEARRQGGISFLLLDMDQPGVTVRPIIAMSGDHETNQLFFDDAVAGPGALVGEEGQGWAIAKFLLENERGGSCHAPRLLADLEQIDRIAAGQAEADGGALATDAPWRRRVARVRLGAQALELIELRILADIAQGRAPGPQTSLVKFLASTLRQEVDLLGLDVHGVAGLGLETARPLWNGNAAPPPFTREAQFAAPRYLNSRAWTIFGGTNEVQANIIAKTVLGL